MAILPPSEWPSCLRWHSSASFAAAAILPDGEEPKLLDLLDLVALGTVADVARLHGLNRAFVTQGLKVMAGRQNIGMAALAEAARLVKAPTCRDLGFALGPRINAGGRVGKADLGVRLLTCTDAEEARSIASELDRLNEERRAIETIVCEQAEAEASSLGDSPVVTVMARGWHPGVIGIVAGRLKERFGRPAIVIAEDEDGTGKGSGRSISGVDLGAAVLAAKDSGLLIAGGGHAMAAGLTLPKGGLAAFRDFINDRIGADVERSREGRALLVDAVVAPGGVVGELCDSLEGAGPYGAGWPSPKIVAGPARLLRTGIVGNGHVRGLACGDDGKTFKWIAFRSAETAAWAGTSGVRVRCPLVACGKYQARRMEWRQRCRNAPGRRRTCLTPLDPRRSLA